MNRRIKLAKIGILKPSQNIINRYEVMKHKYTKQLNQNAQDTINELDTPKEIKVKVDLNKVCEEVIKNKEKYIGYMKKGSKPYIITQFVQDNFNIGGEKAKIVKKKVERELFGT
jgi:hypothetical protein